MSTSPTVTETGAGGSIRRAWIRRAIDTRSACTTKSLAGISRWSRDHDDKLGRISSVAIEVAISIHRFDKVAKKPRHARSEKEVFFFVSNRPPFFT